MTDRELKCKVIDGTIVEVKPQDGWLDIKGAPRDGSRILVINDRGIFCVEYCDIDEWWLCVDGKHDDRPLRGDHPTHYMPLPKPPATEDV